MTIALILFAVNVGLLLKSKQLPSQVFGVALIAQLCYFLVFHTPVLGLLPFVAPFFFPKLMERIARNEQS